MHAVLAEGLVRLGRADEVRDEARPPLGPLVLEQLLLGHCKKVVRRSSRTPESAANECLTTPPVAQGDSQRVSASRHAGNVRPRVLEACLVWRAEIGPHRYENDIELVHVVPVPPEGSLVGGHLTKEKGIEGTTEEDPRAKRRRRAAQLESGRRVADAGAAKRALMTTEEM